MVKIFTDWGMSVGLLQKLGNRPIIHTKHNSYTDTERKDI